MTVILLPDTVLQIHNVVIRTTGGEMGRCSKGQIQICLEYPFHDVYGYRKFRSIFQQAGALLFTFATFHSCTDGNKRTALIVTQLFLNLNGYRFSYPKDTEDKVKAIASGRIESNRTISKWLRDNSRKSRVYRYGRDVILPDVGVEHVLTQLGMPIRIKRIE